MLAYSNILLGLAAAGLAVLLLALFWPRTGLLRRWRESTRLAERIRREDALKHILKAEVNGQPATLNSLAGALQISQRQAAALLDDLEQRGLVAFEQAGLRLNDAGRELALHVIRAHRLWESYLADQTGVVASQWHRLAERAEHRLSPPQADALAARLGFPTHDPHGDAIPDASGRLRPENGQPLSALTLDTPALIVHLEDEPQNLFAQLSAAGLRPGMKVCLRQRSSQGLLLWADGRELQLPPLLANNVTVAPLPQVSPREILTEEHLDALEVGSAATVLGLSPACRGPERRRLLDLGFVPGTDVSALMRSPAGDPTAYQVRGTTVALRREQAGLIRIRRSEAAAA